MNKLIITSSILITLFALQGCVTPAPTPNSASRGLSLSNQQHARLTAVRKVQLGRTVRQPLALVAQDLVNALTQIPQFGVSGTTIGVAQNGSKLDVAVANQLGLRGILTSAVRKTGRINSIRTSAMPIKTGKNEVTVVIAFNDIAIKRSYEISGNFVRPVSALYVRGYSPKQIRLDDRIFVSSFSRKT